MAIITDEDRAAYEALSPRQKAWVADKCNWECMTRFAVMREFGVPHDNELDADGCGRPWEDMVRHWLSVEVE
jgi:hypothetical protein